MSRLDHLNYCRQLLSLARAATLSQTVNKKDFQEALHLLDLCASSQKFLLPFNGVIIEDKELRALDDTTPLHLPTQCIALEFRGNLGGKEARRVVFAREVDDGHEKGIVITPFAWLAENGTWATKGSFWIPCVNYLDRSVAGEIGFFAVHIGHFEAPEETAQNDVATLLGFCNALSCSNIQIERSESRKAGKKVKSALPFDSYHILTIDVSHVANGESRQGGCSRAPREHLRRGHIRRIADGRRIWVNATLVNAGRSAGKIHKDYRLKKSGGTRP